MIAAALYRVALRFAPPEFQREYAAAMLHDFRQCFEEERTCYGSFRAWRYACAAIADAIGASLGSAGR